MYKKKVSTCFVTLAVIFAGGFCGQAVGMDDALEQIKNHPFMKSKQFQTIGLFYRTYGVEKGSKKLNVMLEKVESRNLILQIIEDPVFYTWQEKADKKIQETFCPNSKKIIDLKNKRDTILELLEICETKEDKFKNDLENPPSYSQAFEKKENNPERQKFADLCDDLLSLNAHTKCVIFLAKNSPDALYPLKSMKEVNQNYRLIKFLKPRTKNTTFQVPEFEGLANIKELTDKEKKRLEWRCSIL